VKTSTTYGPCSDGAAQSQLQRYEDLPTRSEELAAFCNELRPSMFVDAGFWFQSRNGEIVFAKRKKHNGKCLQAVAAEDPSYPKWILGLDEVPADSKEVIQTALGQSANAQ